MALVLNIEFFKIRPCEVCSNKEIITWASSTVQIIPTKYLVHPTLFRHTPSHVGFVRTVKNLTLTCFSDTNVTLFSI